MAKKTLLIKELRSFFKLQAEERKTAAVPEDDSLFIQEILNEPNPGVARAKELGLPITVAKGNTIYEIAADNTRTEIGQVRHSDVTVEKRRYSIQ